MNQEIQIVLPGIVDVSKEFTTAYGATIKYNKGNGEFEWTIYPKLIEFPLTVDSEYLEAVNIVYNSLHDRKRRLLYQIHRAFDQVSLTSTDGLSKGWVNWNAEDERLTWNLGHHVEVGLPFTITGEMFGNVRYYFEEHIYQDCSEAECFGDKSYHFVLYDEIEDLMKSSV